MRNTSELPIGLLPSTAAFISPECADAWAEHRSFMMDAAMSLGASSDEAEDLCQEAVFSLARSWPIQQLGHTSLAAATRVYLYVAIKRLLFFDWSKRKRIAHYTEDFSKDDQSRRVPLDAIAYRLYLEEPRGNDLGEMR